MSSSLTFVHPDARVALHNAFVAANIRPIIVQTEGGVLASAGTHLEAGKYLDDDGKWQSYSACIDLSVNQLATRISDGKSIEMNVQRINWLLEHLSEFGFAGFHRTTDEGFSAPHMHIICAMVKINLEVVVKQVIDFVNGRSGLKSHGPERYWTASDSNDAIVAHAFAKANPTQAYRLPSKYR